MAFRSDVWFLPLARDIEADLLRDSPSRASFGKVGSIMKRLRVPIARSSLLHPAATPLGSLTPAEAPLIDAENLFRQPGPPLLTGFIQSMQRDSPTRRVPSQIVASSSL